MVRLYNEITFGKDRMRSNNMEQFQCIFGAAGFAACKN